MKILDFFKKSVKNKDESKLFEKALFSGGMAGTWSFQNNLDNCGELVISLELFYKIQKTNAVCQAMKDIVAQKVAKNGLYLEKKNGDVAERPRDKEALAEVLDYFSTPTLKSFKGDYFSHYFAGGEVFIAQQEMILGTKPVLVDNRTVAKKINNKTGAIEGYEQRNATGSKQYMMKEMYNHIIKRDPDRPNFGISKYYSVIYDVLSSNEIGRRNYYFFVNNAKPGLIVMMKQIEGMKPEEYTEAIRQFEKRYSGASNNNKPIASNAIEDIKILEMNHKDLQLIQLDVLNIKKVGMIFGIDPRLLGFSDDVGAYATMSEIGKHSMDALSTYQRDFEVDINNVYRQFVDPSFEYIIRCDGESYTERENIEDGQRKDIELGIITIEEARSERGLDIRNIPEGAKKHYIKSNLIVL